MVVMTTSMSRKNIAVIKNMIGISGYHFMMLWKGYLNLFFSQTLEDIWSDVYQRFRGGIS